MNKRNLKFKYRSNQCGVVLVVAMVILLVMSVIGISSLTSSTMQERMAGNNRQRALAQAAAEAALKEAEDFLLTNIDSTSKLSQFDGSNGLYSAVFFNSASVDRKPLKDAIVVLEDDAQWTVGNSVAAAILSNNVKSKDPRFVIEYIGQEAPPATANLFVVGAGPEPVLPHVFVISAIGWGVDQNIYTVLQTTFRTGSSDFAY